MHDRLRLGADGRDFSLIAVPTRLQKFDLAQKKSQWLGPISNTSEGQWRPDRSHENVPPAISLPRQPAPAGACAGFSKMGRERHHGQEHSHDGHHDLHHDLNPRSAYLHVMADAATSILAIVALIGGKFWGASWLDTAMGFGGYPLSSC